MEYIKDAVENISFQLNIADNISKDRPEETKIKMVFKDKSLSKKILFVCGSNTNKATSCMA